MWGEKTHSGRAGFEPRSSHSGLIMATLVLKQKFAELNIICLQLTVHENNSLFEAPLEVWPHLQPLY